MVHGGIENSADVDIQWINSEKENNISLMKKLKGCNGILIPGGFGIRGINGKINATNIQEKTIFLFLEYVLECS